MTAVLIALHTLAAAVWLGALFYGLKVLPKGLAALDPADRVRFAAAAAPRFFGLVAIVAATPGYAHAMAICGWIMIGVAGAAWMGPAARLRRAARGDDPASAAPALAQLRRYVAINAVLAVAATILGAAGPHLG